MKHNGFVFKDFENWRVKYDSDSDMLYVGMAVIPKDTNIYAIASRICMQITKDNEMAGFFIEYFTSDLFRGAVKLKKLMEDK